MSRKMFDDESVRTTKKEIREAKKRAEKAQGL